MYAKTDNQLQNEEIENAKNELMDVFNKIKQENPKIQKPQKPKIEKTTPRGKQESIRLTSMLRKKKFKFSSTIGPEQKPGIG